MTIELIAGLEPLRFLLGKWNPADSGDGSSGGTEFKAMVMGNVIVRENFALVPATADHPAARHEDLMVIYLEAGALRADYYDNEAHVIRYTGTQSTTEEVVFVCQPEEGRPGFRLSYRLDSSGLLHGAFEFGPQPGVFVPYLAWTARRP
ncbi:MAG TPA: hypothetical protein VGK87_10210 [Anaerolineae bacterium]|jgi:hypothetical protein